MKKNPKLSAKTDLIPGTENWWLNGKPKLTRELRWEYPMRMCRFEAEDTRQRVLDSKKLFPWKFFRGDCHSHTQHSDGIGTVQETAEMVKAAGLDFQFVTDHWGLTQTPECREYGLWVGQEPTTTTHHLGILGLDYTFAPEGDFLKDWAALKKTKATIFLPHPTGWWPVTVYSKETVALVDKLESPFLMEICNGANNIIRAFDYTDDSAIRLWDKLLAGGKVVHAMGNTDAHAPHGIGMVWNGVFAAKCEQKTVLKALSAGKSFVSDGPLLYIAMGGTKMGGKYPAGSSRDKLKITAVDSRGLVSIRVIGDKRELLSRPLKGVSRQDLTVSVPRTVKKYVRVEVRSADGRRAYSNPIYLS